MAAVKSHALKDCVKILLISTFQCLVSRLALPGRLMIPRAYFRFITEPNKIMKQRY